jgi:hypothetical protein
MTQEVKKDLKSTGQNPEAKAETTKDHAEEKRSSEGLNEVKVKVGDAASDVKRDL